jgi:hypothetical protein
MYKIQELRTWSQWSKELKEVLEGVGTHRTLYTPPIHDEENEQWIFL